MELAAELTAPWTVLFGPSGSGKSTLLRALCGLIPLRNGFGLSFDRHNKGAWTPLADRAPNHRALAYAPQNSSIFPHLTVGENVRFAARLCAESAEQAQVADEAITLFRLHALEHRQPQGLSGGELQRVALARAFATPHACLMLLDEPFSGLDRGLRDELLPAMRAWLARHDIPCLSVTHDVDEALLLDAEVLRIDRGRVIAQGPAEVVLAADRQRLLKALRHDGTPAAGQTA